MLVFSALSFLDPITEDLVVLGGRERGSTEIFRLPESAFHGLFLLVPAVQRREGEGGKKGCAPTGRGAEEETFYRS